MSLEMLADLAVAAGYGGICMRASQIGVHSSQAETRAACEVLNDRGLSVTMITGDFDVVYNNDRGPNCLRNISPYLDLAESLGAPMIRICIKQPSDMEHLKRAADEAAERKITLVHQCHVQSLFETVKDIEQRMAEINHPNVGLIFEAANLEQCGQDYGTTVIRQLAPWIRNVYLQNQRLHPEGAITLETWSQGPVSIDLCEIHDSGGIEFETVFKGLREIDYAGPITVHQSAPENQATTPLESAQKTSDFLRQLTG